MARRIQEMDWSAHALGPIRRWPRPLRTVLGVLLASRQPMWLGWGREFFFFANDALQETHPRAAGADPGARAREVWKERWDAIGPRLRSVLARGEPETDGARPSARGISRSRRRRTSSAHATFRRASRQCCPATSTDIRS